MEVPSDRELFAIIRGEPDLPTFDQSAACRVCSILCGSDFASTGGKKPQAQQWDEQGKLLKRLAIRNGEKKGFINT